MVLRNEEEGAGCAGNEGGLAGDGAVGRGKEDLFWVEVEEVDEDVEVVEEVEEELDEEFGEMGVDDEDDEDDEEEADETDVGDVVDVDADNGFVAVRLVIEVREAPSEAWPKKGKLGCGVVPLLDDE